MKIYNTIENPPPDIHKTYIRNILDFKLCKELYIYLNYLVFQGKHKDNIGVNMPIGPRLKMNHNNTFLYP